ncbi:glycerol-3-phosphate responsive antiterminator [bacterium LRH843]|nr:glycerol-3-phosphate responsive antiterminator [bacterium LRH843]
MTNISKEYFYERLEKFKLIASVKDPKSIDKVIQYKENISSVMLLTGNIQSIKSYVQLFHSHGLPVILDIERIGGLKTDYYGMNFISNEVKPFAIVTNKSSDIKRAKANQLYVVQRIFLIDTEVLDNLKTTIQEIKADMIEIMPSRLPDITREITSISHVPIVTGGFLNEPVHIYQSLENGAKGVVTSNRKVWKLLHENPELISKVDQ